MMKYSFIASILLLLFSCSQQQKAPEQELTTGAFRALLTNEHGKEVPFNVELTLDGQSPRVFVKNASETIELDSVFIEKDSIYAQFPIYQSALKWHISSLRGRWFRLGEAYELPLKLVPSQARFPIEKQSNLSISGRWESEFRLNDNPYKAIGEFVQNNQTVTGTFIANSGDKRFLEGVIDGDSLYLSGFDGTSLYLISAQVSDSGMQGEYFSGKSYRTTWKASRNQNFELPAPSSLVSLVEGAKTLPYTLPALSGDTVSSEDDRFKNKVVIVQITGSWCPNCKDEGELFGEMYQQYHDRGLEIVALSFERSDKLQEAKPRIKAYIDHLNSPYLFLFGGKANKESVLAALPTLADLQAYPTSIFIDKKGLVRHIHTGFRGPGTSEYEETRNDFTSLVEKLLEE